MNATLRKVLIVTLKNAIRAVLMNVGAWGIDPDHFNVITMAGLKHIGLLALTAVASAEAVYWVPKLLAWANSPTNGD